MSERVLRTLPAANYCDDDGDTPPKRSKSKPRQNNRTAKRRLRLKSVPITDSCSEIITPKPNQTSKTTKRTLRLRSAPPACSWPEIVSTNCSLSNRLVELNKILLQKSDDLLKSQQKLHNAELTIIELKRFAAEKGNKIQQLERQLVPPKSNDGLIILEDDLDSSHNKVNEGEFAAIFMNHGHRCHYLITYYLFCRCCEQRIS